jgi:alkanesulfonate monooxygenase SsuD/methylene tetrahydromethanopterin reductase-like flavin-dependent oxidoreductase (luciferase family)
MRFAVLDIVHPRLGVPHADTYQEHLEQVRLADKLGFDHYWFLEHHLHPGSLTPSPNLLVAAAAPVTQNIRLGSMVNILPFRNPVILAEELAMLDNLTQGRLDVGIGRGLKPDEFQALGVPMAESRPMFGEALQVLLGVWANDAFQFRGHYFFADKQAPLRPSLVQQPHPPLYMSAASQESLRWTAERDMYFGQIDSPVPTCARDAAFYHSVQQASGFPCRPRLFLARRVYVGETDAAARRDALPHLMQEWELWSRYTGAVEAGLLPDSYDAYRKLAPELAALSCEDIIAQNIVLFGSPEHVAEQIREHLRHMDIAVLACFFQFGQLDRDHVLQSMRLFADQVIPALAQAPAAA